MNLFVTYEQLQHLEKSVSASREYWQRTLEHHLGDLDEVTNLKVESDDFEASYFLGILGSLEDLIETRLEKIERNQIFIQNVDNCLGSRRSITTIQVIYKSNVKTFYISRSCESWILCFESLFDAYAFFTSDRSVGQSFCCEAELEYFLQFLRF